MKQVLWLVVWLMASAAYAEIKIPAVTPIGKKIEAELLAAIPVGAEVQGGWVIPDCDTDLESPTRIQIWATPGKHEIKFQGAWMQFELVQIPQPDGTTKTIKSTVGWGFINEAATFVVGEGDDPVPPPPPPPPPGERRAVILEESEQRTTQQAVLFQSLTLAKKAEVLDDDQPSASKYLPLLPASMSTVRPVMLVMAGDKLVRAVPCPTSIAAVDEELKR